MMNKRFIQIVKGCKHKKQNKKPGKKNKKLKIKIQKLTKNNKKKIIHQNSKK